MFKVGIPDSIKSNFTEIEINDAVIAGGNTLRDIDLPDNTLVVMVFRDGNYFVPRGNNELHIGDRLLVVSDKSKQEMEELYNTLGIKEVTQLR